MTKQKRVLKTFPLNAQININNNNKILNCKGTSVSLTSL